MAHPFINYDPYEKEEGQSEPAFRCYGLGKGKDVSKKMEKMCRQYLINMFKEHSEAHYLHIRDSDNLINPIEMDKHKNPLYETWRDYMRQRSLDRKYRI